MLPTGKLSAVRPRPPSAARGLVPAAWARCDSRPSAGEHGLGRVMSVFWGCPLSPQPHFTSSTPTLLGLGRQSKTLPPWTPLRLEQALLHWAQVLAGTVAQLLPGARCWEQAAAGSRGFLGAAWLWNSCLGNSMPHAWSKKAIGCSATIIIVLFIFKEHLLLDHGAALSTPVAQVLVLRHQVTGNKPGEALVSCSGTCSKGTWCFPASKSWARTWEGKEGQRGESPIQLGLPVFFMLGVSRGWNNSLFLCCHQCLLRVESPLGKLCF